MNQRAEDSAEALDTVADCGAQALALLSRLVAEKPPEPYEQMAVVVRAVVRMRDELIRRRRAAGAAAPGEPLTRINAVLSVAYGAQHPIVGVKRERIEKARDALRDFMSDYEK